MKLQKLALIFAIVGTLLAVFVAFFKQGHATGGLGFALLFVVGPWLVLDVLFAWLGWARGFAIAGGLMLLLEVYIYYGVFVNPQSSTDAIAYVFKPGVQLLIFLPLGLLIGRALDKQAASQA